MYSNYAQCKHCECTVNILIVVTKFYSHNRENILFLTLYMLITISPFLHSTGWRETHDQLL